MSDKRPFERARLDGGRVRRRNHGETESSGAKTGIPFSSISGASDVTRGAAASSRSQPPVVSSTSPLNNGERGLSSTARSRLRSAAATRPSFVSRRAATSQSRQSSLSRAIAFYPRFRRAKSAHLLAHERELQVRRRSPGLDIAGASSGVGAPLTSRVRSRPDSCSLCASSGIA